MKTIMIFTKMTSILFLIFLTITFHETFGFTDSFAEFSIKLYRAANSDLVQIFKVNNSSAVATLQKGSSLNESFALLRKDSGTSIFKMPHSNMSIGYNCALFGDKTIYNIVDDYNRMASEESQDCLINWVIQYNPLTLVGDLFCYEKYQAGQIACGPPDTDLKVVSLNLQTGEPAIITDYFFERSLMIALSNDQWVLKKKKNEPAVEYATFIDNLKNTQTLTDLILLLSTRKGFECNHFIKNFFITEYNAPANKVSIRLVKVINDGYAKSSYLQLGIIVTPTDRFTKQFEIQNKNSSFFAGRFSNGLVK